VAPLERLIERLAPLVCVLFVIAVLVNRATGGVLGVQTSNLILFSILAALAAIWARLDRRAGGG